MRAFKYETVIECLTVKSAYLKPKIIKFDFKFVVKNILQNG